jgi:long-subunit acyl-CoA synthetase (AMP-forming)
MGDGALDATSLCQAFQVTAAERAGEIALRTRDGEREVTWGQYARQVRAIAGGLATLGVQPGDTLALMLVNRPEFHITDCAAMHLGVTTFSIYNTSPPEEIAYVVGHAGARFIITERAFVDTLRRAGIDSERLLLVDDEAGLDGLALLAPDNFDFDATWRRIGPDDPLVLIYTSGTTGPPKGVELTHGNLLAEARGLSQLMGVRPGGRLLSYFPMAHIAERNTTHYLPIIMGLAVTSCPDPREVAAYLPEVRPTGFFGAPRIWEKLKLAIELQLDHETRAAVDLGLRLVRAEQAGEEVPDDVRVRHVEADRQYLAPIRHRLGLNDLDWVVTGSAPTPREVVEFFHALGIPVGDVWGLSETSAAATVNPHGAVRIGTVGKPLPGVELTLAEDGEVLVRGPIVMKGYRDAPEKTRDVIDAHGWFRTGDIGQLDGDGYLVIVDRKKELIINAAGKNMSPANIEARVKTSSPVIGQCAAVGDSRPYNVALIALDSDGALAFARDRGIPTQRLPELASDPAIVAEVEAAIERANSYLARVEQIKRFHIVPDEWQPGSEELTPTMKLKRRAISEKYAQDIDRLYVADRSSV